MDPAPPERVPLVSVVVALCADDQPGLFARALDSVAAQTIADWECIVAADGPLTPELEGILTAFAARDARLRRVDLPVRSGPAAARNRAVAQARGRYTAVLDADDCCVAERLERQVGLLEQHRLDLCGSRCRIGGAGEGTRRVPTGGTAVRRAMWLRNPLVHSSVLARTELLAANPYPEHLRYGEDYRLWVDLALKGHGIDNHPDELVVYTVGSAPKPHGGRRGRFAADLVTRLRALRLLPPPLAVLCAPAAVFIAMTRLLPDFAWRMLRRVP